MSPERAWRRCDWRTLEGKRCRARAQGHVGMLHLCRGCLNSQMLKKPLTIAALREPFAIDTTLDGEKVGTVVWEPYGWPYA